MHTSLDPLSAGFLADPYPFLAQQRETAPVAFCDAIDMWVVTRHEDVEHVFLHPELFSASVAQAPLMGLCDEAASILKAGFPQSAGAVEFRSARAHPNSSTPCEGVLDQADAHADADYRGALRRFAGSGMCS